MFSALVEDIQIEVLSKWVDFLDLRKFDFSICNHVTRKAFLNIISSNRFIYHPSVTIYNKFDMIWLTAHDMKMNTVVWQAVPSPKIAKLECIL